MNKVIHSQSSQSPFGEVGASQAAVADAPSPSKMPLDRKSRHHFVVIPVADADKLSINALQYAKLLSSDIVAVHVLLNPSDVEGIEYRWKMQNMDIPLMILDSPDGSIIRPLMAYVERIRLRYKESVVTIVLPVLDGLKWWQRVLHNQTAGLIERGFQSKAGVATVRVPFFLAETKQKEKASLQALTDRKYAVSQEDLKMNDSLLSYPIFEKEDSK
jgi:hypothetical protein